ncbi:MAG: Ldh family oxidoreductase [Lachnospiraceae bacterium]
MSVIIEYQKIESILIEIFIASGISKEYAQIVANNLVTAEMRGVKSHGLVQTRNYSLFMRNGKINVKPDIRVIREYPSVTAFDADYAPGSVAGKLAMKKTIEKAKETGIAMSTVKNGTHFGIAAYYAMDALKENMIGLAFTNSAPMAAPYGGYARELGTNPICVAVPAKKHRPIVFDAATTVAAFNKIFFALTEKNNIPDTWALDGAGNVTTNPGDVIGTDGLLGALLPFGGYKGYGLAVIVNVLTAVLSGCGLKADGSTEYVDNVGFNFAAIDISKFTDFDEFTANIDLMIERLKNSKKRPGFEKILVPGEPEFDKYDASKREGILILDGVENAINTTLAELNINKELADYGKHV